MAFSREALNTAVSEKLADCNGAAVYHQGLFGVTQISGVAGIAGAILIAPLAIEVAAITGVAGLAFYGISQLLQTKRTGHFLPLPCVPVSAGQLGYVPSKMIAQLMNGTPPEPPEDVRLLPSDWLPQRERRINYLLTHCPDILITAAENAQEGISFAAIVDSAVRASEMAISDEQIQNPVLANKLRGDVRALLTGDTSRIEAQQTQAIAAEWKRAQLDHSNGQIDDDELRTIEADVRAIAPQLMGDDTAVNAVSTAVQTQPVAVQLSNKTAYESITASPYRSRFFLGGQRTGKSYLAVSSAAAAAKAKGAKVYYLNLSAWGTEDDGYSAIADRSITANIQALTPEQAEETINGARKLLQAFFIDDSPAILLLEEWCELGSRNHQHKARLESLLEYSASIVEQLANTGQKRRKAIYATGPMFVAGSLQQATKAAKTMALVLVAIAPGKVVDWQGQPLSFDPAVFSMAANNWHGVTEPTGSLAADRIALVDGEWMPVGNIPTMSASTPKQSKPPVIDVDSVDVSPAAAVAAAPMPSAQPSRWDKFRFQSEDFPHMIALANWLERREGKSFDMRSLKKDKTVMGAFKDANTDIQAGLNTFTRYKFIAAVGDGEYQIVTPSQPAMP